LPADFATLSLSPSFSVYNIYMFVFMYMHVYNIHKHIHITFIIYVCVYKYINMPTVTVRLSSGWERYLPPPVLRSIYYYILCTYIYRHCAASSEVYVCNIYILYIIRVSVKWKMINSGVTVEGVAECSAGR